MIASTASWIVTFRPTSSLRLVTGRSVIPHGFINSNQLRSEVDGEAVHGHPSRHPDSEGGDLPLLGPDPGEALLPPGIDPEVGEETDQDLFELANVRDDLLGVGELDDRVAHQLAGAVEG